MRGLVQVVSALAITEVKDTLRQTLTVSAKSWLNPKTSLSVEPLSRVALF